MQKLIKKGYPLSKILGSLTHVLQYDKAGHYGRTNRLFEKLFIYDLLVNQNKKLLNHLNYNSMQTPSELEDIYTKSYESEFSDFLGLGKETIEVKDLPKIAPIIFRWEANPDFMAAKQEYGPMRILSIAYKYNII